MASIIKRGKSYCVVYDYVNSDGQRKQKWETFPSKKEASVRKSEVELAQKKGTFLPPSAETVAEFMDEFVRLYVCMNLSFACSLRIGEILGLTWNNVHISEQEIKDDDAWLYIMQELARVKRSALAALNNKNIYHIFPAWTGKTTSTVLVLKKPKTDSSIRRVWIPKTVAYVLQELRKNQLHQIELAGCDYTDYNLVIAFPDGHPCEEKRIILFLV